MKILSIVLLTAILLAFTKRTDAQDGNNTIYHLENLPQRVRLNPAYQPEYKVWIGLPVISGVSVNYFNSSFSFKNLITKKANDSLAIDFDRVYRKLKDKNTIFFNNENALFSLGIKAKSWYVTLDVTQKNDFAFSIDKGLFTFLKEGNAPYIGKNFEMGGIGVQGSVYEEIAFGLSKKINDKLTVGGRVKYLLGIGNISVAESNISLNTAEDLNTLSIRSQQEIRISGPINVNYNTTDGYIDWEDIDTDFDDDVSVSTFFNTKNSGFGIDLGAEYKLTDKLNLSASLLDFGFIKWGDRVHRFQQDARFDWKGADISNSLNKDDPNHSSLSDSFEDLVDTLKRDFRLRDETGSYRTTLNTKLYLGATYQLHRMVNVGGLAEFMLLDKKLYPTLTASANFRVCKNLTASTSYSYMPGYYGGIGAAITAKLGYFQLYLASDNLLAANYTNAKATSLRFGVNMLFGHRDRKKKSKEIDENPLLPVNPVVKTDTVPVAGITEEVKITPEERDVNPVIETLEENHFYVVVGSFINKKAAEREFEKFVKEGYKESGIVRNDANMYRVYLSSYKILEEAQKMVEEIKHKYKEYPEVWVAIDNVLSKHFK